jgi:hypothetical protein
MRKFIGGPGKAIIVCATRTVWARLYDEITSLRPGWHDDAFERGKIKVVYASNPSDPADIRRHVRRPSQNKAIQHRSATTRIIAELIAVAREVSAVHHQAAAGPARLPPDAQPGATKLVLRPMETFAAERSPRSMEERFGKRQP